MKTPVNVICVVGARPNFMKISPILKALRNYPGVINPILVHTGQHYDAAMNDTFFTELGIPDPDVSLNVGSGSHAVQTAEIMLRFEPVIAEYQPAIVVVVGDVNSTLACTLVAAKLGVPVAHVEAGLRSFDTTMPEEQNRLVTDRLSSLLFTTERAGNENLAKESVAPNQVRFVGNVMIDTLVAQLSHAPTLEQIIHSRGSAADEAIPQDYAVLTLHRPSNVDDPDTLKGLLAAIARISDELQIIFAVHPRTQHRIDALGDENPLKKARVLALPPLSYREMLGLMKHAKVVITDSGGLQEETTYLGVPCLTLRDNTERPVTVTHGTNRLVGASPEKLLAEMNMLDFTNAQEHSIPDLWDGKASERIAEELVKFINT